MIQHVQMQHIMTKAVTVPGEETRTGAIEVGKSFGDYLQEALSSVNAQKIEAEQLTQQYLTGEISDVHSVMIAAEKASLALELTVQVRNKVIEAYQEIMRIQL